MSLNMIPLRGKSGTSTTRLATNAATDSPLSPVTARASTSAIRPSVRSSAPPEEPLHSYQRGAAAAPRRLPALAPARPLTAGAPRLGRARPHLRRRTRQVHQARVDGERGRRRRGTGRLRLLRAPALLLRL